MGGRRGRLVGWRRDEGSAHRGTGLISTAITRQLLQRGDEVTHFNRGRSEARYGTGDAGDGEVRRLQGDRKDFSRFEAQLQEAGPFDCVIDMICFTPAEAESLLRAVRGRTERCSSAARWTSTPAGPGYPIREDAPWRASARTARTRPAARPCSWRPTPGEVPVTVLRPAQTYGEGRDMIHTFGRGTAALTACAGGCR